MLTLADVQNRVNEEMSFIGGNLTGNTTLRDNLIKAGLRFFVEKMDYPIVSANLSVTSGTISYSVPEEIEKIYTIRNAVGDLVPFDIQKDTGNLIFYSVDETGTYTIRGTPAQINTSLSTIISLISESCENVLMSYIRAAWYETKNQAEFITIKQHADSLAYSKRGSLNRELRSIGSNKNLIDAEGNITDNINNPFGIIPTYTNMFGGEL